MTEQTEGLVPDWAALRDRYELAHETVTEIGKSIDMTGQALSRRAKALGWALRGSNPAKAKSETTRQTLRRLKEILHKRLIQLEGEIGAIGQELNALSNERDIRSANTLVRTLEKVLELEQKDRKQRTSRRQDNLQLDDAQRDELAGRIAGLCESRDGSGSEPHFDSAGSGSTAVGMATVGEGGSTSA